MKVAEAEDEMDESDADVAACLARMDALLAVPGWVTPVDQDLLDRIAALVDFNGAAS